MTMPTDDPGELADRVLALFANGGPDVAELIVGRTSTWLIRSERDYERVTVAANAAPTLAAEVKRLTAELADWKESARIAAGETCGTEKHCTCVPLLRMELAAMEKQIAITELAADLNTIFTTCEKCWASVQKDSGAVCKCVVESLGAENARLSADLAALRRSAADTAAAGERDAGRAD